MDYNNFSEETKLFINKAMDIYSTMCNKCIIRNITHPTLGKEYRFTKLDKKLLSILIAGFMVDGDLKNILEEYDDIRLQDLLEFTDIKEDSINKLNDDEYLNFYNKSFRIDMEVLMKYNFSCNTINFITPTVIAPFLKDFRIEGSSILNYYSYEYCLHTHFCSHPLFNSLETYNLMNGSINPIDVAIKRKIKSKIAELEKDSSKNTINYDNVWQILDKIQEKFVGQENAVEGLFYNIINNQQLAEIPEIPANQMSLILLDGPSGTGKTAITREIAEKLEIPFVITAVTNYSSTGYFGGDITDILKSLLKKSDGDLDKAQRGIVILDEFDKIAYSRDDELKMKKAVQQELLDFLGGSKYLIHVKNSDSDISEIEFDTSKLTFVCLAALTDLRLEKIEKQNQLILATNNYHASQFTYTITVHDLIKIGFEKELVGRLNTYLHTDNYSTEALLRILSESTISPLLGFKKWVESNGKKLEIDSEVYNLIASQAYELDIGARGLQKVMNDIRTHFIKEVLRGTNDTIYLDVQTIKNISGYSYQKEMKRLI